MKILHFADLHLGVESYGRINPETGLSTRVEDFLKTFDKIVDFAVENRVDLVLFCGDAYKSREPTQTQQREFAKRIRRFSEGGIPVFLLIGNHDSPNTLGRATSTEIFDTLGVRSVYVSNKPDVYRIETSHGVVQVVSLPWLRRSSLLAREDTKNLTFEEINKKLEAVLTETIDRNVKKLDPSLPAVLVAHVWVANAKVGSEKGMTIGQEHTLLLSNVARTEFDYVALGHIHRHQVLSDNPPVVYAGSPERVDFGEEDDDKGFYLVDIETDKVTGKRQTRFNFQKLEGRRFITISVEIQPEDLDPTGTVLKAISEKQAEIKDAIVRLELNFSSASQTGLRDADIKAGLEDASYFAVSRNVKRESRMRLSGREGSEITPGEALKEYLESKKVSPERMKILLEHGGKLIESIGNKSK